MTPTWRTAWLTACLSITSVLPAVEVAGDPAWLNTKFRADWRMMPLEQVLDEIQRAIDRPLVRSSAIAALEDRTVLLTDEAKQPIKATLERLEALHGLSFRAEGLRLLVETAEQARDRRRRPVDVGLFEYGIGWEPADRPGPALGLGVYGSGGGGTAAMFADAEPKQEKPHAIEITGLLHKAGAGEGVELRGGAVRLLATPDEEKAVRAALAEDWRRRSRRLTWTAVAGTLPAGEALVAGRLTAAEARTLGARLAAPRRLAVDGFIGQRVHAAAITETIQLADLNVVSERLDPSVDVLRTGLVLDVRSTATGSVSAGLLRFQWCDLLAGGTSEVVAATHPRRHEDAAGEPTPNAGSPDGQRFSIDLPRVWSWSPTCDVVLPTGTALVLVAARQTGTAVVIIEAQP